MITNGTLLTSGTAERIKQIGVSMVSVSIDGTKDIHDAIRGKGMYEKSYDALKIMGKQGIKTGCITSVMKENFSALKQLKEELVSVGVERWQLQLAFPEGNMCRISNSLLEPEDVPKLIDLAAELAADGKIRVILPDNVGYYTELETSMRSSSNQTMAVWKGCNAGIRSFGILSNGAIVGCTSMRGSEFTEGRFPQNSLKEIWNNPDAFAWRRKIKVSDLNGDCEKCRYAAVCLGGCSNIRYTVNKTVCSSNPYCAYHSLCLKKGINS
jgi:radical SAM protein with 4Fe4S-binding SPASM domain